MRWSRRPSTLAAGGGILLFGATALTNVAAFLFHVVVSRRLSPADYGALGAILAIMLVLAVPAGALQVAVTRAVAERRSGEGVAPPLVAGPLLADGVIMAGIGGVCLGVGAPVLRSFLHLEDLTPALLLAAWAVTAGISLVPKAVLLGELRFRRVGIALVAGAIARLGFAALLSTGAHALDGAMAATVLSELVIAAIVLSGLKSQVHGQRDTTPTRIHWREVVAPVVALGGFWLLTAIDTVMARRVLPAVDAGHYAAAATAARAVLFVSSAIALIAFPRFAEGRARSPAARAVLFQALGIVITSGITATIAMTLAPKLVIRVLFGSAYLSAAGTLGVLALSSAFLGVIFLLVHYHLAAHSRLVTICGPVAGLTALSILVAGSTPPRVALLMLASTASTAVVLLVPTIAPSRRRATTLTTAQLTPRSEPLDVTVVVPYFNPGPQVASNIEAVLETLRTTGASFEVIAVSDGSTDGSDNLVAEIRAPELRKVALPTNEGKGAALRVGLAMGQGSYVGFIDADGDVDPRVLIEFMSLVRLYQPDVVLASKRHPLSAVQYPLSRRIYSWGYQQLTRVLFHLNVRDTQTGAKLIRRDVLALVLPRMLEKRFAFDLELLTVARRVGYRGFFEAPVHIEHQFHSTVSRRAIMATLIDTMAVFYRLYLVRWYDTSRESARHSGPVEHMPPSSVSTQGRPE